MISGPFLTGPHPRVFQNLGKWLKQNRLKRWVIRVFFDATKPPANKDFKEDQIFGSVDESVPNPRAREQPAPHLGAKNRGNGEVWKKTQKWPNPLPPLITNCQKTPPLDFGKGVSPINFGEKPFFFGDLPIDRRLDPLGQPRGGQN
ncbi:MAG: hypothetical protein CM15mP46_0220 [Alphaproteobacteria bacterium]|nr:MAG: hypothetical protein CM15mP46_0220 [Alphaproteobacteria bacterium]